VNATTTSLCQAVTPREPWLFRYFSDLSSGRNRLKKCRNNSWLSPAHGSVSVSSALRTGQRTIECEHSFHHILRRKWRFFTALHRVKKGMRWITTASFVVMGSMIAAGSCGGDDDEPKSESEQSSSIKTDGSRLAACFATADCKEGLLCYGVVTDATMATAGFCTDACTSDDPFAADAICAPIKDQAATCSPDGQCRVDCTGGGSGDGKCPSGMECRDTDPSEMRMTFRCAYPIGTGRGKKKLWEECNPARGSGDCASPNECVPYGMGQNRRGYCSAPCEMDSECEAPAGATARPLCAAQLGACSLDCADGATCPNGMECINTGGANMMTLRCRYVPAGAAPGMGDMSMPDDSMSDDMNQ
jgi:hypothetical protein